MSDPRQDFLLGLAEDLRSACGLPLVWKDADPLLWGSLPAAIAQHRSAACRAVKRSPRRVRICSDHCNHHLAATAPRRGLVTCPFGLCQWVVPVVIADRFAGNALLGCWRDPRRPPEDDGLRALWQALPTCPRSRTAALARLVCRALQTLPPTTTATPPAPDDIRYRNACDFIDAHLHLGLRAAAVAHHCHLSISRFVHWFKEAGGLPYRDHLRARVLQTAAARLIAGREMQRIDSLALDLGFASHSAFTAAFRRHFGQTPSAFRAAADSRI